jgi:sortase A
MKVLVRNASLRLTLKWAQRVLLSGAALLLGYCAFVMLDTWMFQYREQQSLDRLQTELSAHQSLPGQRGNIGPDGLIGRIEIPRLNMSVAVVEGTGAPVLRRAVGHIVGTAWPGQRGNIGIAAHRDTFFRPLKNIQRDDVITLTTPRGQRRRRAQFRWN